MALPLVPGPGPPCPLVLVLAPYKPCGAVYGIKPTMHFYVCVGERIVQCLRDTCTQIVSELRKLCMHWWGPASPATASLHTSKENQTLKSASFSGLTLCEQCFRLCIPWHPQIPIIKNSPQLCYDTLPYVCRGNPWMYSKAQKHVAFLYFVLIVWYLVWFNGICKNLRLLSIFSVFLIWQVGFPLLTELTSPTNSYPHRDMYLGVSGGTGSMKEHPHSTKLKYNCCPSGIQEGRQHANKDPWRSCHHAWPGCNREASSAKHSPHVLTPIRRW